EIYLAWHNSGAWHQLAGSAEQSGISSTSGESRRPAITTDASGNPIVAWTEIANSGSDILVARFDPSANGGAGDWIALGDSLIDGGISNSGYADNVSIILTSAGPVVLWLDKSSGTSQIYAKRFNGTSWIESGSGSASGDGISGSASGATNFAIATDGTKIAVAWTEKVGETEQVYVREYNGSSWNELAGSASGNGVSNNNLDSLNPSVAYHDGSLFVAWEQVDEEWNHTTGTTELSRQIYVARYNSGTGSWVEAGIGALSAGGVSHTSGAATRPRLASGGGKLYLTWIDEHIEDGETRHFYLYAKEWNGTDFVEEIIGDASGYGISQTGGEPDAVTLSVDQTGHPFVAWGESSSKSSEIYVRGNTFDVNRVFVANETTSIQSIIHSNNLTEGDVIYVEAGTYSDSITISAADSGFIIVGSPDLGSEISGSITIDGTSNIVLQRLKLSGNVNITGNSSNVSLRENSIENAAVTLSSTTSARVFHNTFIEGAALYIENSSDLVVSYNTFNTSDLGISINTSSEGTIGHNDIQATNTGIRLSAAFSGIILNNKIHDCTTGLVYDAPAVLSGNRIFGNDTGISTTLFDETEALGYVGSAEPNNIYQNTIGINLHDARVKSQHVFLNTTGISGSGIIGGDTLEDANLIEKNYTGIGQFSGTVQYNRISRNTIGIQAMDDQTIYHNLIYRNVQMGLAISGVSDVRVINNTFYTATGDNIRLTTGANNVEIRNNILWTEDGYDIYVANDSQTGFYSDYNLLHASGTGKLVFWTKDFADILDWQADVARFDLHSMGTTVINPAWSEPRFVNRVLDDYRIFGLTARQRFSSPSIDSGDPRTDLAIPVVYQNLLVNPDFESGLTGWDSNEAATVKTSTPDPFSGSQYFFAGNIEEGFAQQTIDLLGAGFTTTQLDSQNLEVIFTGRIRARSENRVDKGNIEITFLDETGSVISTASAFSENPTNRWDLVGGRVQLPVGTRQIVYRFTASRETGSSNDSYLDFAAVYVVSESLAPNIGAYGNTNVETETPAPHIELRFPDLYTDWEKEKPHTITWDTFGNSGNSPVRIDLYQDGDHGPEFLKTITELTADDGEFIWIPGDDDIDYGTHGLRFMVSLVDNPLVFDRSTESFTVPDFGYEYYVDNAINDGDKYTGDAIGSNRHTGKTPDEPKPNPVNILRIYDLGVDDILYIDAGNYPLIYELTISGTEDLGLGLDEAFTMRGPSNTGSHAILTPAIDGYRPSALIELNDADYVTLSNLTLVGAQRGLWVHNGSDNLQASYIEAYDHSLDAIRIEESSTPHVFDHLTAYDAGEVGIYISGEIGGLKNSISYNNQDYGIYLENTGNAAIEGNEVYGNRSGIYASNNLGGTTTVIGNSDLSLSLGNIVHDNSQWGLDLRGATEAIGNAIFGHTESYYGGIVLSGGEVSHNVIFNNSYGISGYGTITGNRIYNSDSRGINLSSSLGTVTENIIYSSPIGIYVSGYGGHSATIKNNLIYDNSSSGISIHSGNNHEIINNTFYETGGNAVTISGSKYDELRNNIFWVESGYAIFVDSNSQVGFESDFNLFHIVGEGKVGYWQGARKSLTNWINASFKDKNSLMRDPLFVDPDGADNLLGYAGTGNDGSDDDFHLQSPYGSFHGGSLAPVYNSSNRLPVMLVPEETFDVNLSPAIDRGDALDAYDNEPVPNGGYINLGAYGNTAQASKSPEQYVLVIAPNGGEGIPQETTYDIKWRS
ncbi:MAG: hypothetical protein DRG59_06530, partial [Deltaproteobacteria bacterium]